MKLILHIKKDDVVTLELKQGSRTLGREDLTISRNLDKLLITSIDKLANKNKIDRLSLKTLEIRGNLKVGAVSGMVMKAIKAALRV